VPTDSTYINSLVPTLKPALMLSFVRLSPLDVLVPGDFALATLVSLQSDTPAQVLCDSMSPTSLVNGAIDCLDLVPPLFGDDLGKISRGEGLF